MFWRFLWNNCLIIILIIRLLNFTRCWFSYCVLFHISYIALASWLSDVSSGFFTILFSRFRWDNSLHKIFSHPFAKFCRLSEKIITKFVAFLWPFTSQKRHFFPKWQIFFKSPCTYREKPNRMPYKAPF